MEIAAKALLTIKWDTCAILWICLLTVAAIGYLPQHQDPAVTNGRVHILECQDGLQNPLVLKEVGSGLNNKRKKLIKLVLDGKVNKVYVTYRDRLTRFGYHYLESMFLAKEVDIVVLDDISQEKDIQQELVENMMSLIASFSGKLYGMCSHKNKEERKV